MIPRLVALAMLSLPAGLRPAAAHILCGVDVTLDTQPRDVDDGATVPYTLRFCDAMQIDGSRIEYTTIPLDPMWFVPASGVWTGCPTGGCSIDPDGTLRLPLLVLTAGQCVEFTFTLTLLPGLRGESVCVQGALRAIAAGTSLPCDRPTDDPLDPGSAPTCVALRDAAPSCTIFPAITPAIHQGCVGTALELDASSTLATGCPGGLLGYQWLRDGIALPGATADSWTIAASEPPSAAAYRCLVSCAALSACRDLSTPVAVTLLGPGTIVADPVACQGSTVQVAVPGASTCSIDCGNGDPPIPACLVDCTYTTTGRHTVAADATDSLSCRATLRQDVEVIAAPVACIATPAEACEQPPGGPTWIRLDNCSTPGLQAAWSSSIGTIDDPAAFSPWLSVADVLVPTSIDLTLDVAAPSCATGDRDSRTLTVKPTPRASFTWAPAPDPCPGEPLLFLADDARSPGPFDHQWDFGDFGSSTLAEPTHAYAVAGRYRVTLTRTDTSSGCISVHGADVVIADPCCSGALPPVAGVRLGKGPGAADVIVTWDALAASSGGYNVWMVLDATDIPDAREPGGTGITRVCSGPSPGWCVHSGARPSSAGTPMFYQVRGLCRSIEGL